MEYMLDLLKKTKRNLWEKFRFIKLKITDLEIKLLKCFFKKQLGSITLQFWADKADDGSGAQIQRILTTRALADYLGCGYRAAKFKSVTVHPLDPFQTKKALDKYLIKMNKLFHIESTTKLPQNIKQYEVLNLNSRNLLRFCLISSKNRRQLLVKILSPYSISEAIPNLMLNSLRFIPEFIKYMNHERFNKFDAAVHYRQGVGGFTVFPGQSISRQLPVDYFLDAIRRVKSLVSSKYISLAVLTDSPVKSMKYSPLMQQISLWNGTPGFQDKKMSIISTDLSDLMSIMGVEGKIYSGGDPIDAIAIMAKADYLIMSLSSLSFLAGIFNNGLVVYPSDFWHRPLNHWQSEKDFLKIID
jgi:hypothetical protein